MVRDRKKNESIQTIAAVLLFTLTSEILLRKGGTSIRGQRTPCTENILDESDGERQTPCQFRARGQVPFINLIQLHKAVVQRAPAAADSIRDQERAAQAIATSDCLVEKENSGRLRTVGE